MNSCCILVERFEIILDEAGFFSASGFPTTTSKTATSKRLSIAIGQDAVSSLLEKSECRPYSFNCVEDSRKAGAEDVCKEVYSSRPGKLGPSNSLQNLHISPRTLSTDDIPILLRLQTISRCYHLCKDLTSRRRSVIRSPAKSINTSSVGSNTDTLRTPEYIQSESFC